MSQADRMNTLLVRIGLTPTAVTCGQALPDVMDFLEVLLDRVEALENRANPDSLRNLTFGGPQ